MSHHLKRCGRLFFPVLATIIATALFSSSACAQSSETVKTITPHEISHPLGNPYMGWGIWAGPRYFDGRPFTLEYNTAGFGDDASLFGWVLIDWMWSDLEPEEGRYYWKDLDTIINYWGSRGKQIELRIWVTDDPGWNGAPGNEVCPEWLWKAGARFRAYEGEGKSKKREPDYTDPSFEKVYLPKVRKFLSALAERYDKADSAVMLWGAMGYGQWGEWHTLWSHYPWPSEEVKHRVLAQIVNMYSEIFKEKPISISYCIDADNSKVRRLEDFLYRQGLDQAIPKGFALARHGFIDGLDTWDKMTMEKFWKTNPMWAEGDWSYMDMKDHGTHGTLQENLDIMLAWHSNWAHFYMDADGYRRAMREDRNYFEGGLQRGGLGYRLVPTQVSWREELPAGDLLLIRQNWINENVGRLYVQHPLKVYLTDSAGTVKYSEVDRGFSETSWVSGRTYTVISVLHLPKDLEPGTYDLRIALVDSAGKPRIRLGIEGEDPERRYRLGTVCILPRRP